MFLVGLVLMLSAGCTAMTGKSLGENIDDASITASVKTRLAAEKMSSITRIDVDTNQGTVYLNGIVDNTGEKQRATDVAQRVNGVRQVVNNLKIQGQ
jgi:osmotically-inducible protein OsmY